MSDKYIKAKNYVNLYKFASIKLDQLLSTNKRIVLVTNCASLIAGLSFNLIKIHKHKLMIIMNNDFDLLKSSSYEIVIILAKYNDFKYDYDFYFEYVGDEENILLC